MEIRLFLQLNNIKLESVFFYLCELLSTFIISKCNFFQQKNKQQPKRLALKLLK